jgi:plastocyanin
MVRDALLRSAPHHEARKVLRIAAAFAFLLLAPMPFARAEDVKVSIDNFTFNPQQLTVKAGTKVTFANHDDIPHTVVSLQNFKSKVLDTKQEFAFTFTTPGTYTYFCSLHPHMTGTIVVEASSSATQ